MGKERARKKSFQQSLEDIKEKMKEKRNKRLASAAATSMGRVRIINKSSGTNSTHTILMGIQLNNKSLAVALQTEREKVRQANAVILQLKREQQALFLHLLLLKRKLKEQEALVACVSENKTRDIFAEPQHHLDLPGKKPSNQRLDEQMPCEASPICPEKIELLHCDKEVTLPSTVGVRRRRTDRRSRRRSKRLPEKNLWSEEDPISGFGAVIPSPILCDGKSPNKTPHRSEPEVAEHSVAEELYHSTPESAPPKKSLQQPSKKQAQQQLRSKPEPASQKPERGRKAERAPLKKPWENPKPRARSKSRDRSATRARTAPQTQGNKLNTSLGFNDTFDFDCEGTIHITPFKAKVGGNQPSTPISEEARTEVISAGSEQTQSSSSSPSSESEDSLYVPQKTRRKQAPPEKTKVITTRRGRSSKVVRRKENLAPKREKSVFREEESVPKLAQTKKCDVDLPNSPGFSFSNTVSMNQENQQEPNRQEMRKDRLLPVSPLVEAEMMRIDNVLSSFGEASCESSTLLPHKTPKRRKTCTKGGLGIRTAGRGLSLCDVTNLSPAVYRNFSCGGTRPSDSRCSTPVPARKRRSTTVVDYKEPSLNAKLRRGDKFTDLQFLRSPIFKQKSDQRSVQKSRASMCNQQPFEKYNESFVGCR